MNKVLTLIFAMFLVVVSFGQSREIVWSDEFNYVGLPDENKWSYDVGGGGWGNNELQYYTENRAKNARVENGNLIIEAHYETYGAYNYTSARLVTREKGDWKYGYFEMRAILPSGRGTWPAFWMLPTDWEYGGWPDSGEIDIMEHVGYDPDKVHGTVHTKAYNHMNNTQKGNYLVKDDYETAYHVYACEWDASTIRMFIDGKLYFSFPKEVGWEKWPFNKRFHILLNIAVGGNWGGQQGVDNSAFPTQYIIDYIRVYGPGTGPTGLIDKDVSDKINVYPNPTSSNFYVDLKHVKSSSPIEISIYNSVGQIISIQQFESGHQIAKLDLSLNPSSTYFYVVSNGDGILKRGGILKN